MHTGLGPPLELIIRQQRTDTSNPSANDSGVVLASPYNRLTDCFSDDSAFETESQSSEDEGLPKIGTASICLDEDDEEYYTDRRIAEWVSKVNLSLFSTTNDKLNRSRPVDEQDISTIKIIYNGD